MVQIVDNQEEFAPGKNQKLLQIQKVLKSTIFQKGKRAYAIRVYRTYKAKSQGYYQCIVRADGLNQLRLKCIKYLPWDLDHKYWPVSVCIYRNSVVDKYNHAGYLEPCRQDHSIFVWIDEVKEKPYDSKVDSRTGAITKQKFEQDTAIPYKPGRK